MDTIHSDFSTLTSILYSRFQLFVQYFFCRFLLCPLSWLMCWWPCRYDITALHALFTQSPVDSSLLSPLQLSFLPTPSSTSLFSGSFHHVIYLQILLSGFQGAITDFFFIAWYHTCTISPYYIYILFAAQSIISFSTQRIWKALIHKIGSWFFEVSIIPFSYIAIILHCQKKNSDIWYSEHTIKWNWIVK